jgi:hypothetical protein
VTAHFVETIVSEKLAIAPAGASETVVSPH